MAEDENVTLRCEVSGELHAVLVRIHNNEVGVLRKPITKAEILLRVVELALAYPTYKYDTNRYGKDAKGSYNCTILVSEELWTNTSIDFKNHNFVRGKTPFFRTALALGCAYYEDHTGPPGFRRSIRSMLPAPGDPKPAG